MPALTVLERWGTMSFEQVSARAIEYAGEGFPLRPLTAQAIKGNLEFFKSWPHNQKYWLKPDGSMYAPGDTIKLPTLARTLRRMVEAERANQSKGRCGRASLPRAIGSTRATSPPRWWRFCSSTRRRSSWPTSRSSSRRIEEPAVTSYRGYEVYKHAFGSQGPVLLQTLNILEQFDLRAMKHNSADYLHTVVEALKLAYADRDTYYADPAFVQVPAKGCCRRRTRANARS